MQIFGHCKYCIQEVENTAVIICIFQISLKYYFVYEYICKFMYINALHTEDIVNIHL